MKKIRGRWVDFWTEDESDDSDKHLSKSDKNFLLFSYFMVSAFTVVMVLLAVGVSNLWAVRRNTADMERVLDKVETYLMSATEDEYDRIARTVRHDLVFRDNSRNMQKYARYISNSSEQCCACKKSSAAQAVLISLNTGESYDLDLRELETGQNNAQGSVQASFGYDEISQARFCILKSPEREERVAKLERGNGIVSIHRMKKLFCDNCVDDILKAVEGEEIEEFVICDTEKNIFYPVKDEDEIQIGNCMLQEEYRDGVCEIRITFIPVFPINKKPIRTN